MNTVIGVDLGGTKIYIGEVTVTGEVLSSKRYHSVVTSQEMASKQIITCLTDFFKTTVFKGKPIAIGVGLVGRINRDDNIWIEIHPELSKVTDVASVVEKQFGIPCYLGNDVYCATLAEKTLGVGNVTDNFVYLNIGTGIAAGCVVYGSIIEGANYDAGEIGHMVVAMDSKVECICGRKGCVETLASGLGMHNQAMQLMNLYPGSIIKKPIDKRITSNQLFDGYDQEDSLCQAVVDTALWAVATTIMNLIRVTDPEVIVLGGGVGSSDWFIEHLVKLLNNKAIRFIKSISKTNLPVDKIGLIGAALLAIEKEK